LSPTTTVDKDDLLDQFLGGAAVKIDFRRVGGGFAATATARAALISALSGFGEFCHDVFWVSG
jgi:hypothetical protein